MRQERKISIHAPRTGSDALRRASSARSRSFQSTLPARGATGLSPGKMEDTIFQSTLPARGATAPTRSSRSSTITFQSTLPARGATRKYHRCRPLVAISIHAPRTGSDCRKSSYPPSMWTFQSTLPARGATAGLRRFVRNSLISIHAPRTGSDQPHRFAICDLIISIHAPRTGSDLPLITLYIHFAYFNPRSPHGERLRKVTILSIRIIGFAQKVYHKTVLLRISLAENAVILPEKPRNPVRTSLQKAGGLRFARAIRAARPYSISSPSGA